MEKRNGARGSLDSVLIKLNKKLMRINNIIFKESHLCACFRIIREERETRPLAFRNALPLSLSFDILLKIRQRFRYSERIRISGEEGNQDKARTRGMQMQSGKRCQK